MMKKRVTERVLVLILSIAVLLSSTGVYSVFAENYSETESTTSTTVSSSSTTSAATETESQETTTPDEEKSAETTSTPEPNVITEGGTVEIKELKGTGKIDDPYRISDADELFRMQDIINDSTSSDKYFVLSNDIDLSTVSYAQLKENSVISGTIVSVDKSKSDAAPDKVQFTLNGLNHRIFGLNVTNTGSAGIAVFGYISAKSVVKNVKFEDITVNVSYSEAVANGAVALYNNGQIRNCETKNISINVNSGASTNVISKVVNKSVKLTQSTGIVAVNNGQLSSITAKKTTVNVMAEKKNIGIISGVNSGTISSVTASGSTVKTDECSSIGIAAGKNSGKIESVTAEGIKATVTSNASFGGIAGENSGTIVSCVASGKANGSSAAGGIVGKATSTEAKSKTSNVKNCYSFVRVAANSETGAVIAKGESRYSGNVWSSETSGRVRAYENGVTDGDFVRETRLAVVQAGSSKTISKASLGGKSNEVSYVLDSTKDITFEGSGISYSETEENIVISAESADKIGKIVFTARLAVPAGNGGEASVSQSYTVKVLTVPAGMTGNGLSEDSPIEIANSAELRMISAAPFAHFELTNDVKMPADWNSSFSITGSINGNGHKITASDKFCYAVYGKITNLNISVNDKLTTAVFGKAVNAEFTNVRLTKGTPKEDGAFVGVAASKSGTGAFLNKVSGKTKLTNCFTNLPISVSSKSLKNIAGFIAVLDTNDAVIKSCGAVASITGSFDEKISSSAAFIGKAEKKNANGSIVDCYATLYSDITSKVLIGGGEKDIIAQNAVYSSSNKKAVAAPSKFENVKAEKWAFEDGIQAFITGKDSSVSIKLPENIISDAKSDDFKAMFDSSEINVALNKMTVENSKVSISVAAADGIATVRDSSLVLVHKATGLRAEIAVSSGLDKDENGNYIISSGSDFIFINDCFESYKDKSFVISKDIDMSDVKLSVIGGAADAFSGKLDGNGHKISGLNLKAEAKTALFGALDGAEIKDIVFDGASVKSTGNYTGVLAAQITGESKISNVTFTDCKVLGNENYAGILAGEIKNSTVSAVEIKNCEVTASNNVGILSGCADSAEIKNISAESVTASGENNVGLVGYAKDTSIKTVTVKKADFDSEKNVGGVAGEAVNVKIESAKVSDSEINASAKAMGSVPAAGGIGGMFSGAIADSSVKSTKIKAEGNAATAGGIIAVSEKAALNKVSAGDDVTVNALAAGGIIGEAKGATSVADSKSSASVAGDENVSKVIEGAGGIIGRVTADDFGAVVIENTNSAGKVKAASYAGGIIGSVLSSKAGGVSVMNCVSAAEIEVTESEGTDKSGHVIGYVSSLESANIKKAVKDVVFSSYASELSAYGNVKAEGTYCDLDSAVKSSLSGTVRNGEEVTVKVSNDKAESLGFKFDSKKGWQSESENRISVIDSSEKKVKIKACKTGTVGIVGTYKLSGDEDVALKVHFNVESKIHATLKGNGTKDEPYLIANAFDLEAIADYAGKNAYFSLEKDIAFKAEDFDFGGDFYNEGKGFTPIGTKDVPFNGTFEGNGHKISGLVISDVENASLFGFVSDAEISNINFDGAEISASALSAVVASSVKNSEISDITVSDSKISSSDNQGSVAAIAAFAEKLIITDAAVKNSEITASQTESANNVACASVVCARAVDVTIKNTKADENCKVVSGSAAGGFTAYCDKAVISSSETFADVKGSAAAAVAADVKGVLSISNTVAGGKVNGSDYAAGIAAKADAAIKASDVTVSARVTGDDKVAVVAAYANEEIFNDSAKSDVKLSNILYSSYQNSSMPFSSAKINSYQSADYLNAVKDVNKVSAKSGEAVVIGKDKVKLSDVIVSEYDMSAYECTDVYSVPENLVKYNKADGTIVSTGTADKNAVLVIKYNNGLETAVPLVSIKGMTGSGTNASPYVISNEDTLKLLRVYPNAVFMMSDDITLTESWTPVENFSGILDGAGHTISGLNVKADNAGLFVKLSGNASVKNITFSEASIEGKSSAGVAASTITDNAKITGVNVISSSVKADDYAGAVVGIAQALNAQVDSCKVTGTSVKAKNASGIAALVKGNASFDSDVVEASEIGGTEAAGGIISVADAEKLSVKKCEVTADISAKDAGSVAGITENAIAVESCTSNGTVSGTHTESGMIGFADGSVSVKNSGSYAELSGNADNTAAIVAKFETRPEDNESFKEAFSGNKISGEYDEFEPAVMQYQNFVPAAKEEAEITLEGSGTKNDPYIISSAADLAKIPDSSTAYYVLNSDIKLTAGDYGISINRKGETVYGVFSDGYRPIKDFAGTFDGKGHVIEGLYINCDCDYAGLFANITANGTVKNLHVELAEEKDGWGYYGINGSDYVGGIAGYCDSVNGIENCSVSGSSVNGDHNVGGLVGGLASSKIVNSFAACEINAQNKAGGIAGTTSGDSVIRNSFAACDVNAAGGTIVGVNNGNLVLDDVMVNGNSYGTGAIAVSTNNGTITARRVLIAGGNADEKSAILGADEAKYVYSDKTALGVSESGIKALTTSQLTSSKPEGLENWKQSEGKYPVPSMADDYSNKAAAAAAVPAEEVEHETSAGNVQIKYKLVNSTGEKYLDSKLAGVLIKSNTGGTTITSDFFAAPAGEKKVLEKVLVKNGGFYVDSSLPEGYEFRISATDSKGRTINVSDAGSLGAYVESGSEKEVDLVISIIRTETPWGVYSLWESLVR